MAHGLEYDTSERTILIFNLEAVQQELVAQEDEWHILGKPTTNEQLALTHSPSEAMVLITFWYL